MLRFGARDVPSSHRMVQNPSQHKPAPTRCGPGRPALRLRVSRYWGLKYFVGRATVANLFSMAEVTVQKN